VSWSGGGEASSGCSGVSLVMLSATVHPLAAKLQGLWRSARNAGAGRCSRAVRALIGKELGAGGRSPDGLRGWAAQSMWTCSVDCVRVHNTKMTQRDTDLEWIALVYQCTRCDAFRIAVLCVHVKALRST
jgi:hypothetical protein